LARESSLLLLVAPLVLLSFDILFF
jgi:hypothetical protein